MGIALTVYDRDARKGKWCIKTLEKNVIITKEHTLCE